MKFKLDSAEYEVDIDPEVLSSVIIGGSRTLISGTDGKSMSVSCMFPEMDTAKFELTGSFSPPMVTISMSANTIYLMQDGYLEITEYTEDKWVSGKFYGTAKLTSSSGDPVRVSGQFHLRVK